MGVDIGRVVAGKYELTRLLGRGAMGEVWLATHKTLGGDFAVKIVHPTLDIEREVASKRFTFEAQVSAKLSRMTRHIVSVVDHGEEDGVAYLVMEQLVGEPLEALIDRQGPLDLPLVTGIVAQVARALAVAHREGVIHRDLKPGNLFLTRDEDGKLLVKLLDFGIAKTAAPERSAFQTAKDMVLGTPAYMSPEQARGVGVDPRCDVWALAVVAYEALAADIPWEGNTAEEVFVSVCVQRWTRLPARRPDLSLDVAAIFMRAFRPDIAARFQTPEELAEAFESLVAPGDVEAAIGARISDSQPRIALPRPASADPVVRPSELSAVLPKKSGIGLALLAGAVVALLGLGVAALMLQKKTLARVTEIVPAPPPSASSASSSVAHEDAPVTIAAPPPSSAPAPSAPKPVVAATAPRTTTIASVIAPPPTAPPPPPRDAPPQRKPDKGEIF